MLNPNSHSQLSVLLLPGAITTHTVVTNSVFCSCQATQVEIEDKHINNIVEEHYERYFDQEKEYMREIANRY